jgi:hypothetical protein
MSERTFKLIVRFANGTPYVAEGLSARQVKDEMQMIALWGRTVITVIPTEEL